MERTDRPASLAGQQELVLQRTFDAPRDLVWQAWTDPAHFMQWWGPDGFTTPHCTIDLRPGGLLHYCMRSSEGKDYWGRGIFREVVPPERLVYVDAFSNEAGDLVSPPEYGMAAEFPAETLVTVLFEEVDGKTELTLHFGISQALAEESGAAVGWSQSFDRLAAHLERVRSAS